MKIQLKFIIFALVIGLLSFFVIIHNNNVQNQIIKLNINNNIKHKEYLFNTVIKLKIHSIKKIAEDYTYWDDMVNFAVKPNTKWAIENLDPLFKTLDVNYISVYNENGLLVYNNTNPDYIIIQNSPFIKSFIDDLIENHRYSHFYVKSSIGIIEMSGASIHPTIDINKTTKPRGYLILGKLWDEKYIEEIEKIVDSKIEILSPTSKIDSTNNDLTIFYKNIENPLNNSSNLSIIKITPNIKDIKEINDVTKYSFFRMIIVIIFFIVLTIVFIWIWFVKPFRIILYAIKNEDIGVINKITNNKTEFGDLSSIVNKFLIQKQEIEKNAKQFKDMFQNHSAIMLLIDPISIKITDVNRSALRYYGYTEKEFSKIHLNDLDVLPIEDLLTYTQKANQNQLNYFITKHKLAYGDIKDVEIYISPINSYNKKLLFAIIHDITERKTVELNLRKSEQKYRLLFSQMVEGFALQEFFVDEFDNTEYYKFIEVNPSFLKIFNKKNEDIIDKSIDEGLPSLSKILKEKFQKVSLTIKPIFFEYYSSDYEKYFYITIFSPQKKQFATIIEDITENKNIEESLKYSEETFRAITNNAYDAIVILDENRNIIYWNIAAEKLFGYSSDEVINKPFYKIIIPNNIHDDNYSGFYDFQPSTYESAVGRTVEINAIKKDLSHIIIELSLSNVIIRDKKHIVTIIRDITEKKTIDEIKRAVDLAHETTQIKQQFFANVSHEIRTPLTGIIGMIDFLHNTKLDETQKEYSNVIKNSAENLLNIINDILNYSKLQAGKIKITNEVFNFYDTILNIENLFKYLLDRKNLKLFVNIKSNVPKIIKADEIRIQQVITNFLSNALKFTNKGSIKINISIIDSYNDTIKIKVEIIDTGIGIKKEYQEKLFTKFAQFETTRLTNSDGIGLGLIISKELVELMNGEIGVKSVEGEGSNFWFTFIAETVNISVENIADKKLFEIEDVTNLNLNILLVEDKEVNQKVVSLMLKNINCKVTIAENGKVALEKFKPDTFDVILMDIMMPEIDGLTAFKELRKMYNNLPPVIALSANAMEGDAEKYLHEGMNDYISKPVISSYLYKILKKWSNKKIMPENNTNNNFENFDIFPVLKKETIDNLYKQAQGNKELIKSLFESFIEESDELIIQINDAIQKKDYNSLRSTIHSLKGMAGTIGASQLFEIAKVMDLNNKSEQYDKAIEIMNIFDIKYKFFVEYVKNEFFNI